MADFFDRLLARSLPGHPPPPDEAIVRPRLPQRFEPPPAPADIEEREFVMAAPGAPPAAARVVPKPAASAPHSESGRAERATAQGVLRVVEEAAPAPAAPALVPTPVPAPARAERPAPTSPTRPATPAAEHTTINVTVAAAGPPVGALLPTAVSRAAADPSRPAPPQPIRALPRRGASTPPQRVVQVSIGRVEVTAAGPQRPAAKRSSRPEPVVSLERYLAREDGRR
jgi:hypothetical protein